MAPAPGPYLFHGDPAFTPEERYQIDQAALAWGRWSKGRTQIRVVYDLQGAPEFRIIRGNAADVSGVPVKPGHWVLGTTLGHRIILVAERMAPYWYETAAHEFGHAIGILEHVPGTHSIMSEDMVVDLQWSPEDEAACRSVRACP